MARAGATEVGLYIYGEGQCDKVDLYFLYGESRCDESQLYIFYGENQCDESRLYNPGVITEPEFSMIRNLIVKPRFSNKPELEKGAGIFPMIQNLMKEPEFFQ